MRRMTGQLKAKLAKLKRELLTPTTSGGGGGGEITRMFKQRKELMSDL
jgi:ribosome-interacting GTPase 1